jgi:hypothetical protein
VNTVLTATRGAARAKFNIGSVDVALPFAGWLSAHGWLVHIAQTREAVYLDEHELCWNATLCEQYGQFLERRKVAVS